MLTNRQLQADLTGILEILPEDKIVELIDFARFLTNQYSRKTESAIDKSSLLLQQNALNHIWDNPEEDIYELESK
ncbi:MAG: hypothetical protein ACUZ8O_12690 [Candidatus Anammoxibacter sp.]